MILTYSSFGLYSFYKAQEKFFTSQEIDNPNNCLYNSSCIITLLWVRGNVSLGKARLSNLLFFCTTILFAWFMKNIDTTAKKNDRFAWDGMVLWNSWIWVEICGNIYCFWSNIYIYIWEDELHVVVMCNIMQYVY